MRAALVRVDVVGERVERLGVAVVPLQGDLGVDAVFLAAHVDRLFVDADLVRVQMLHERDDAAVVLEPVALRVPLVVERDDDAAVEKGQLAQPLGQGVEAEYGGLEDLRVRLEGDFRAATLGRPGCLQIGRGMAALVTLLIDLAVAPDFEIEGLGERVDHRHADAVQTAGNLVAVVVELPAGVENGHDDFGGRLAALVEVDRNAAPVVHDRDGSVDVNRDVHLIAESGQRLVDRVVDDLVDEVMQPGRAGRTDVHGGPLADRLQPLEDLDLVRRIVGDVRRAAMTVGPAPSRASTSARRPVGERLFGVGPVCFLSGRYVPRVLSVLSRQARGPHDINGASAAVTPSSA